MIVYLARNRANGKGYVGKTKRSLAQRKKEHARAARVGSSQPFHRAIRKHGFDAFEWQVLLESRQDNPWTEDDLNRYEEVFIEVLGNRGLVLYNATRGGDGVTGWSPSPEHREKIRQAHLGPKNHNYGKDWGRKGPWSEETKKKMAASHLGLHHSDETKAKIASAQYVRVAQYDMAGNHVATYDSMIEAEQKSGVKRQGISRACRFPHRSAGGFRFRYMPEQNTIAKE